MNVLTDSRTTKIQEAYAFAMDQPLLAVDKIYLNSMSSKEEVTEIFTKVFLFKSRSGLDCELGKQRLEEGIALFLSKGEIPDFVARFIAGVSIGEIDPMTVVAQKKSPP